MILEPRLSGGNGYRNERRRVEARFRYDWVCQFIKIQKYEEGTTRSKPEIPSVALASGPQIFAPSFDQEINKLPR
jgi:hypothetical protein